MVDTANSTVNKPDERGRRVNNRNIVKKVSQKKKKKTF